MDLGTTNTGVALWDPGAAKPRLLELPEVCRAPGGDEPLQAPRLVPSATHLLPERTFWTRMFDGPFWSRHTFVGQWAKIGRNALALNETKTHPNFVPVFKPFLGREPLRTLGTVGGRGYSARDVARIFGRELLATIKRQTGQRIRELVVTTPVDSYEIYRAEVSQVMRSLGVRKLRFIDEPVAAALGYGLSIGSERLVLVVDFGGGTLDLALVTLSARGAQEGASKVVAKAGRAIGGNLVDMWLLEACCERMDFVLDQSAHDWEQGLWYRLALAEARRVKEGVFFNDSEMFRLSPPERVARFQERIRGGGLKPVNMTKADVKDMLTNRGLYEALEGCLNEVFEKATRELGITERSVHDVLMVGGSSLLPGIYPMFEEKFGRDRVRAFQPFEAVAYGACAFAADHFTQSDYTVHDYAIETYESTADGKHEKKYTVIVPRGTRFPTTGPVWQRQLVPTCSMGVPERFFKLVVCEIGRDTGDERRFSWDSHGNLQSLGGKGGSGDVQVVVPLNESNPTLGVLDPPHPLSDRSPRLDVAFGVNDDRWLVATVKDLKAGKVLMNNEAVVRLL